MTRQLKKTPKLRGMSGRSLSISIRSRFLHSFGRQSIYNNPVQEQGGILVRECYLVGEPV